MNVTRGTGDLEAASAKIPDAVDVLVFPGWTFAFTSSQYALPTPLLGYGAKVVIDT